MGKEYEDNYNDLCISFGGENEIEADVLIETINEILDSLQYITTKVEPEANIKVKISSFEPGSFIVYLRTIVDFTKNTILTKDNLEIAAALITIFTGTIDIKKHLKGKKPKEVKYEGDQVIISNKNNEKLKKNRVVAETYFDNSKIDKNITNIFNIIYTDGDRNSFTIKQGKNNIIEIKKHEFENMSKQIITEEDMIAETIKEIIEVNLLLKKPDLLGKSKWGFVLDKNIEATIEDEEWLKKVHSGNIILSAGVKIPVKLLIEIDLDKSRNVISKKYTVLKVTGDIIGPNINNNEYEQLKLF